MRWELTPIQSRTLAIALLVSVVLAAYGLAVAPLAGRYQAYDEDIAALDSRLMHLRRIASAAEATENKLAALKRTQTTTDYYLKSTKRALASAELQRRIKQIVDKSGGRLVSSQVMSTQAEEGFASVAVKVHMRSDTDGLRDVLYGLEMGKPVMFIDDLSVSRTARRRVRGRKAQPQVPLNIEFRVTAHGTGGEGEWRD